MLLLLIRLAWRYVIYVCYVLCLLCFGCSQREWIVPDLYYMCVYRGPTSDIILHGLAGVVVNPVIILEYSNIKHSNTQTTTMADHTPEPRELVSRLHRKRTR